jgi:hypothetical protein
MHRRIFVALCAFVCAALIGSVGLSQYDKPGDKKTPADGVAGEHKMTPEQMKEMEAWMKYAAPGSEHKRLAEQFAGTWDAQVKHWHEPNTPPQASSGVMVNEMCLGDRFLKHNFKGTAMGMPFEGGGIWGYDNALKKYVGVWADNMGTGVMMTTGTYDEAKKQYVATGEMVNPMDGSMLKVREVTTVHDPDSHTMEMHMPDKSGKEFRCMEIKYTRKK